MKRKSFFMVSVMILLLLCRGGSSAQWTIQTSGTLARLNDVVMLDSLTAICVGDSGKILKTTDAGLSWLQTFTGTQRWNEVAFINQSTGFVVGNSMAFAVTTDGGETWTPSPQTGPTDLLSICVAGMMSVFVGTSSGTVMHSDDGGLTWRLAQLVQEPIYSIFGKRGDFAPVDVYAATNWRAFRSSDLGATWSEQVLPITPWAWLSGGALSSTATAFLVGFDGNPGPFPLILRRTQLDTVWTRFIFMPPVLPLMVRDVAAPSSSVAFACASGGFIFRTIDGGDFWGFHSTGTQRNMNAIHFVNERRGFTVGDSGTILFTSNGGVTSVDEPSTKPADLELFQNYPNPFNPSTTIRFQIPEVRSQRSEVGLVTLKVYDVLGREVATLVNETKEPGTYEVEWDAEGMASGVYLYRLSVRTLRKESFGPSGQAGKLYLTRKLVLLK